MATGLLADACAAGGTEVPLTVGGEEYTVDLSAMNQTKTSSGWRRAVRRREVAAGMRIRWNSARSEVRPPEPRIDMPAWVFFHELLLLTWSFGGRAGLSLLL